MPLSIRSPQVEKLARSLARKRKTTMTQVIETALKNETALEDNKVGLREVNQKLASELKAMSKPGGSKMTKQEIDRMWGHE